MNVEFIDISKIYSISDTTPVPGSNMGIGERCTGHSQTDCFTWKTQEELSSVRSSSLIQPSLISRWRTSTAPSLNTSSEEVDAAFAALKLLDGTIARLRSQLDLAWREAFLQQLREGLSFTRISTGIEA